MCEWMVVVLKVKAWCSRCVLCIRLVQAMTLVLLVLSLERLLFYFLSIARSYSYLYPYPHLHWPFRSRFLSQPLSSFPCLLHSPLQPELHLDSRLW